MTAKKEKASAKKAEAAASKATAVNGKDSDPILIKWRFNLVIAFVFLAFAALVSRVAYIQIIEPDNLIRQGDLRSVRVKEIPSARGIISDRNDEPLAVSVPVEAVWADPKTIFDKDGLAQIDRWYALADVLGLERQSMIDKISANKKRRSKSIEIQKMKFFSKKLKVFFHNQGDRSNETETHPREFFCVCLGT